MPRLKGSQIPPSTGRFRASGPRCIQCGGRLAEQLASRGVQEHILCTTLPPEVYDAKAFGRPRPAPREGRQVVTGQTARTARYKAAQQARTALAHAYLTPWTPEDDHELLHGPGTVAERASRLGRTYIAAARRIERLRATQEAHQH